MGIIDRANYVLSCGCGASESVTLHQHGSAYGASWQAGKSFDEFKVEWGPEGFSGPVIVSAKCNSCGGEPKISIS